MPHIGGNNPDTGGDAGSISGSRTGNTRGPTGWLKQDETSWTGDPDDDSVLSGHPPNKIRCTTDDADSFVDYYKNHTASVTSTQSDRQHDDDDSGEDSQEGG